MVIFNIHHLYGIKLITKTPLRENVSKIITMFNIKIIDL